MTNEKDKQPQVNILLVDNGAEVVVGLNLLLAITKHPAAKEAVLETWRNAELLSNKHPGPKSLCDCMIAAEKWIQEINRQVKERT